MALAAIFPQRKGGLHEEGHWIPLSDLMTGLMMVFMLIAIIFMVHVESDAKKTTQDALRAEATAKVAEQQANLVKSIALIYDQMRLKLYNDLYAEFAKDLPGWGAVLFRDLTIRFKEPEVLFDTGKDVLKPRFVDILNDFFPRYVRSCLPSPTRTRSKRFASKDTRPACGRMRRRSGPIFTICSCRSRGRALC